MSIKDKLISNATYLSLNWFFNTVIFMLFWILLGKTFSRESYGIVALAFQVATLLSNLSLFGLGTTINKLIPEMVEKKETEKIGGLISFSFLINLALNVILSLGLIIISLTTNFLQKDILWLVVLSTIALTFSTMTQSVYYGHQNMRGMFLTNLIGWCILFGMSAFIIIFLNLGYYWIIVAHVVANTLSVFSRLLFKRKLFRFTSKLDIDKSKILKYALPAFFVIIFSSILNNSQFIILSSLKTYEETGVFAVAMKIVSVITIIPTTFSSALFPITSSLSVDKKSKSKQSYLISLVFRYTLFIILPMALFTVMFSKYIILFFSSPDFLPATKILPVLIIGGILLGLGQQLRQTLYAIGKPKKYRDSFILSTTVYLFLSIILTYYFSSMGLSIAYLISVLILFLTALIFIRRNVTLRIPLKDMFKISIAITLSFLFLLLTKPFIPNIWISVPFIAIASVLYLLILLKLNFYIEEDLKFVDFVAEKTPIFNNQIIWFRNYLSRHIKENYRIED